MGSAASLVQELKKATRPTSSASNKQPKAKRGSETIRTTGDTKLSEPANG